MSEKLQIFLDLTRLKRPIGYMLLFWPCAWGLTAGFNFSENLTIYFFYLILFFLGSVLMRSAGCIVNDIVDKNIDKKVERTRDRPIASNKVSVIEGIMLATILCLLALLVLLQFNNLTIFLALGSMPLAFTYPLMKRYTYWPQLFLGITFNYGLILGWTSIRESIDYVPIIFYVGAIFWTLAYDTIYGFQDIKDDEIIGVKSTSIKFKNNPKQFLTLCYLITSTCTLLSGYLMNFNIIFFIIMVIPITHLFLQIKNLNINNSQNCMKIFKSNNIFGFLILLNILAGNITG
tara:strand:+ start:293 stop:1162 length:870 start_codon:yes stop_codon:yes gene_type:complete